ncbi:hypothetical protein HPB47_007925 [Ixodes persulcatus]|uniref:Uncharacterized protein n=1 Tax=Ixodes persulcatus TaxID=34615 RepID=A0AC60P630_IXOPE|nr:hypothetical protein HPB47_007925 [Ixodes persulcatus]
MSPNHFLVVMQLLLIAGGRTLDSTTPSPETSETEANKAACHFGQLDHVIFGFVTSSTQAPSTIRATAGPQAISGHGGNARNMSPNHILVVMQMTMSRAVRVVAAAIVECLGSRWINFHAESKAATKEGFARADDMLAGVVRFLLC